MIQGRLTASERMLLWSLTRKQKYFAKRRRLAIDGSFFYKDKDLCEELECSLSTIRRSKRVLKNKGKIGFVPGKYIGQATRYWLILEESKEPIKMTSSISVVEDSKMIPSKNKEPIKMTQEGVKMTPRGCQNDTPTKVITNNRTNAGGSAVACQSQASPALASTTMVKSYIGKKIDKDSLKFLLSTKAKEEALAAIKAGKILLEDGIVLDEVIKA